MRNYTTNALVLHLQRQGESNRLATFLTPNEGIVRATIFGGAKSRLRSLVSPMNTGRVWVSKKNNGMSAKISDFSAEKCRLSFRESLFKMAQADVMAELLIKTQAAGSPQKAFVLANAFLDGMDFFDENESRRGFVRFLWRYLELLGEQPSVLECFHCGSSLDVLRGKNGFEKVSLKGAFDWKEMAFVCADCATGAGDFEMISSRALGYLYAVSFLKPSESRAISIDEESLGELKRFCLALLEHSCGIRLKSLEAVANFL